MSFLDLRLYKHFFFSGFSYTPGLTSIIINQSSKCFEIWNFTYEDQGSSVDKNGNLNGFNSRVKAVLLLALSAYVQKFINNKPVLQLQLSFLVS